jgi:DNA-binding response OmpR family regulator
MHRILMAADDDQEVELLKTGFEKATLSFEMIHAQTVSQVLHHLSTSLPAIIFLDLRLSTAYSWHIIEQIRRRAINNDIPIVMYAGADDAALIKEGFRNGADMVLNRTANIVTLSESLNHIFASDWKSLKQQRLARKLCLQNG